MHKLLIILIQLVTFGTAALYVWGAYMLRDKILSTCMVGIAIGLIVITLCLIKGA